jgi:hypothetical protein
MIADTKLSPSAHNMSLAKILLHADCSTSTGSANVEGVVIPQDQDSGRDILLRAILRSQEPVEIPLEYVKGCTDADTKGDIMRAYDSVLDRHFVLAPSSLSVDSHTRHSSLQRVYGYSEHYLVLEDFSKGTLANFLKTAKGRVQLNAQRRISIMLNVAEVLALQKFAISSNTIGMDNNLNPKVMRFAGANDVHAFGILMVELLTGSLQNDGSDDRRFGDYTERYTTKGHYIEDDLDPYVRESWTFNILSQLIELALKCIQAEDRPTPQKLVETLSLISSRMRVVDNYDYY